MDVYQLNLCGFEKTYLQKLSVYLRKKMGKEADIGIWDEMPAELPGDAENGSVRIWLGGKEYMKDFMAGGEKAFAPQRDQKGRNCFLILSTEHTTGRSDEIYAYQSADVILDFILRHAEQYKKQKTAESPTGARIELFLDIAMKRSLLSCGAAYAQGKGDCQKVLLVDLIPCSALAGMLTLPDPEKDFADLILTLRHKKPVHLSEYIIHSGNIDILPAACNPTVLYELSEEDFRLFTTQVTMVNSYDTVIILAGTPMPGIGYLFTTAQRVICLQDDSSYSAGRKALLQNFYRYSGGRDERWKDMVLKHTDIRIMKETGEHVLFDWKNSEFGEQIRQELLE